MQVTKGTWRMREQCVPGSLSSSPHESLGTRLAESLASFPGSPGTRIFIARRAPRASLVPRPFLCGRGERGEGRKSLVNNSTPTRIHGCIPAVSVDEGKCVCQVGVSRE